MTISLLMTGIGPAYAYLDPGTGSIMLQAIMGAIAGGLVFGRTYLHRLKRRMRIFGRSSEKQGRTSG